MIRFKETGRAAFAAKLRAIRMRYSDDRIAGALYRQGALIVTDAQERYVPVALGNLKNEIRVFPPERRGRTITVTIAAGTGVSRPYALAVHEHPSQYSPPSWQNARVTFSPAGTGVKYLERPMLARVPSMPDEIARDLAVEG